MAGVGPFSEAVLCQTPCSVPAAVNNIYALKESELQSYETSLDADEDEEDEENGSRPMSFYSPSTCLGISWDPPCDHGSEITSYLIDLGERQPIVVGPVTKHIIQHLQPDTSYRLVFSHCDIKMPFYTCTVQLCTFFRCQEELRFRILYPSTCSHNMQYKSVTHRTHILI